MSSKISNVLGLVIGLLLIGLVGFFFFKIIVLIINKIDKLDANIIVAVLAGSFTITGFFITRYLEKKKAIEQQIREQKLPIYEEFIDFIFKVFENTKVNSKNHISEVEMQKFFWKFNRKSILWLSDSTLKSYIIWKNSLSNNEDEANKEIAGAKILIEFEKLLMDFRKDIGHKSANIKKGDILSLFINDWNKYMTKL